MAIEKGAFVGGVGVSSDEQLSIGAIATATGIPVETLRTWERRYGFPEPIRLPSGHRRYPVSVIPKLRLMAAAKKNGLQPADSSKLDEDELRQLANIQSGAASGQPAAAERIGVWSTSQWMTCLRAMDGASFDAQIRREWARLGVVTLIEDVLHPLLCAIGEGWENGSVSVAEEHWASARIRDTLAARWRPMDADNRGPVHVCATLPDEQHDLGLHMLASVITTYGGNVVFLGANTPLVSIADTAIARDAASICVSISAATPRSQSEPRISTLRRLVPDSIELVVGGAGSFEGAGAVRTLEWGSMIDFVRRSDPAT
jgi:DNA-binding transcriptional MerR regulator/methylmalonyl-CoA mutase cobalamin-binding subunit